MSTSRSNSSVFRETHDEFLNTLRPKDRDRLAHCGSEADFASFMRELDCVAAKGQSRRSNRALAFVQRLYARLQPYFDALNVIVGTEPCAALSYGAVRIVLQLAAGMPVFFDKVLAILERLIDSFPQYDAIDALFDREPPPRLRRHLEAVYKDLFQILLTLARVLRGSNGQVRSAGVQIVSTLWDPFESKIGGVLSHMNEHRQFIKDELQIIRLQQSQQAEKAAERERESAEKERLAQAKSRKQIEELSCNAEGLAWKLQEERRDVSISRIMKWLAAPTFSAALETSNNTREEGTTGWISESAQFRAWRDTIPVPEENLSKKRHLPPWLLWVHGNPGWGKTVLAASVTEELLSEAIQGARPSDAAEIGYFFFRYDAPGNTTMEAAYRSILTQALHRNLQDLDLMDKFLFARYGPGSTGQASASSAELACLIRICAEHFGHLRVVLDGLDEAADSEGIAARLKALVCTSPISVVCFSRVNVRGLQSMVPSTRTIALDRASTTPGIELYLRNQLEAMRDEGLIAVDDPEPLVGRLVRGADGMFLWAKLMVNFLSSPALTPKARIDTVSNVILPEGLDSMYRRILDLIATSGGPQTDLARRVLVWLTCSTFSESGVDLDQLRAFVSSDPDYREFTDPLFMSTVVAVCGGLLETHEVHESWDRDESTVKFQFVHLSVRTFFSEIQERQEDYYRSLVPTKKAANEEILRRCLREIRANTPTEVPSRAAGAWSGVFGFSLQRHASFAAYSVKNWTAHLQEIMYLGLAQGTSSSSSSSPILNDDTLRDLAGLLGNPLGIGAWIEALYWVQADSSSFLSPLRYSAQTLGGRREGDVMMNSSPELREVAGALLALVAELEAVEREWHQKLLRSPSLLWDDVLTFPSGGILSALRDPNSRLSVTFLEPKPSTDDDLETQPAATCLSTISETSTDGSLIGVLSIWPPRSFARFTACIDPTSAYVDVERYADGWMARYEVFAASSRRPLGRIRLRLGASDMVTLFRQSFRQDVSQREWVQEKKYFETSFPMAIGPACKTFTVLRDVYHVQLGRDNINTDPTTANDADNSASAPASASVRSCSLPLDFLAHNEALWSLGLGALETYSLPTDTQPGASLLIRDWYTYSVSISPDERLLSFADYRRPCLTTVAIFRLHEARGSNDAGDNVISAKLVNYTKGRISPTISCQIFHPRRPLFAFVAESKVWTWFYDQKWSEITSMGTRFDTCCLKKDSPAVSWSLPDHRFHKATCRVSSISFSLCGEFLLATTDRGVEVIKIPFGPGSGTDSASLEEGSRSSRSLILGGVGSLGGGHGDGDSRETQLKVSDTIRPGTQLVAGDPLLARNDLTIEGEGNHLVLTRRSTSSTTPNASVQLLGLPESFDLTNTRVGIQLPDHRGENLRITINKTISHAYRVNGDAKTQFPAVVDRAPRSIEYKDSIVGVLSGKQGRVCHLL
ncbi:hypothetical protein CTA2_5419 [Colletotrichum tanaceti]|uniref:Nephrocystin 3-like N-terminal domain-containing protein n=1 Tax=Colletotrichum tanaceti TaxID=1306861 RepID=A0A4U6XQA6_9PEZI|nr:hypothetical protein CTA2_5419 [Colletotrichum tanaceti]TKW57958.1 hypothetical protein CTA1_3025 [Colletotrichum tanaceti]